MSFYCKNFSTGITMAIVGHVNRENNSSFCHGATSDGLHICVRFIRVN